MKKIKVGKKAVLFKTNQTEKEFSYNEDMPKTGEILKVVSINGDQVIAYSTSDKYMIQWQFSIEDLKRVKKETKGTKIEDNKSEEINETENSDIFEIGDIVQITGNREGSINSIGDVGVVSELDEFNKPAVRVHVPGKDNEANWSNVEDVEALGLVGSIK
ncbi:hypothetical protein [Exiguobacterium sp. s133]|uniref:hypothetical protein n=1 Tax=Exiguobacterium sp. s133 TaxID=2751213 RepID=UPI001BE9078E|nr:hypothetical protein [Exiguobacterium sp. s133]